jgi:hypothetical protein
MTAPTITALHVPATATLFDAWESAMSTEPAGRALVLLDAMCDKDVGDLSERSLGELNRLLLQARRLLFGGTCDTIADCPGCGAELEATIPLAALMSAHGTPLAGETAIGDLLVNYRVPTWRDLAALTHRSIDDAADQLLAWCVMSLRRGDRELTLDDLGTGELRSIGNAISAADPDALIDVELACPECGDTPRLNLDPASFLWDEVQRWALSAMVEVAELAAAFGWREDHILSLSPWRRRTYLSMVRPGGVAS